MKNTSISLGSHFDEFIKSQVSEGRYKNVSEVIRAGLRILEYEEIKSNLLGLRSGKHIIFYQAIIIQQIEIIRMLHEGMDLIKRLNE